MAVSKGVYSLYNGWLNKPEKEDVDIDESSVNEKVNEYQQKMSSCETVEDIDNFLDTLYKERQESLLQDGEFGLMNLVFKELRSSGKLKELKDKKVELENKDMSLSESVLQDLQNDMDRVKSEYGQEVYDKLQEYGKEHDLGTVLHNEEEWNKFMSTNESLTEDVDNSVISVIANHFDVPEEEIEQMSDNIYSVGDEEYIICSEDEAEELAKQDIKELFEDMGMEAFSENFQQDILNNYVDEGAISQFIDDEIEYYQSQEDEPDMVDFLVELEDSSLSEKLDYVKELLSDGFKDWAKENIDIDGVADEAIAMDGIAHFIASYDGEEVELPNGLYAYRIN